MSCHHKKCMTQSIFIHCVIEKNICLKWFMFHFKQQVSSQGKFYFYVNLISSLKSFLNTHETIIRFRQHCCNFPLLLRSTSHFYNVNKNANHISLLPLQMAWFVVKTKMKRRWLFALPGNPQDFKTLQLVKVNKLDFVCVNKIRNCYW